MCVGVDDKKFPIQVLGKSKKEAEQAFMEVAVNVEERKALNQQIKEAAIENRRDSEEESGDKWVDHSGMEKDCDESKVICSQQKPTVQCILIREGFRKKINYFDGKFHEGGPPPPSPPLRQNQKSYCFKVMSWS